MPLLLRSNVASSPVNRYILKPKAYLGARISLRIKSADQLLIDHIRRTLHDAEKAQEAIDELKGYRRSTVRLVGIEELATDLLPRTLVCLARDDPLINFSIEQHADIDIARCLRASKSASKDLGELSRL